MFTERISSNVLAVVDFNGGEIGHITKSVQCFYARKLGERRATCYNTEAEAAAHFGFKVAAEVEEVPVRGVSGVVAVLGAACAMVAFAVSIGAQVAHFASRFSF